MEISQQMYIFKFLIVKHAHLHCAKHADSWIEQIHKINVYWNDLLNGINNQDFKDCFASFGKAYKYTTDTFDFEYGFKLAKTTWRNELMCKVANKIAHSFIYGIEPGSQVVLWTGTMMLVDWNAVEPRI